MHVSPRADATQDIVCSAVANHKRYFIKAVNVYAIHKTMLKIMAALLAERCQSTRSVNTSPTRLASAFSLSYTAYDATARIRKHCENEKYVLQKVAALYLRWHLAHRPYKINGCPQQFKRRTRANNLPGRRNA